MLNESKRVFRGRLSGTQRRRLTRLLDMMYTPLELADVIGITRRQIYRVYRHMSMPCEVDDTGHIWVNGKSFREWYKKAYPRIIVRDDETFCLTCKRAVPLCNPQTIKKGGMMFFQSTCPNCGRTLARFVENYWKTNHIKDSQEK